MKVAVTSAGRSLDSQVDQRFGRAPYVIVVDTETMDFEVLDNMNVAAAGGAGIRSAKMVIDSGTEVVLTGNCGPNAERTLSAGNVRLYTGAAGTVAEVIELLKNGRLTAAAGPNVEPHFGAGQ